jgi:hypothetical protein
MAVGHGATPQDLEGNELRPPEELLRQLMRKKGAGMLACLSLTRPRPVTVADIWERAVKEEGDQPACRSEFLPVLRGYST